MKVSSLIELLQIKQNASLVISDEFIELIIHNPLLRLQETECNQFLYFFVYT